MKLKGAELIIKYLEESGIEVVAGIPGGANLPLYKALGVSGIKHILSRHEQGAGFFAQGMARVTGKPAVCFATSGPGATNLITAIADAKLDSVPVIAITGQVPTSMIGTDAFQEVDTYGMTLPFCKHSYFVKNAEDLLWILPEAFSVSVSGRPGPVVIDIPKDVQNQVVELTAWKQPEPDREKDFPVLPTDKIKEAAQLIEQSGKPVLYIGGGIIHSGAAELVLKLAEKNSLPVTSTLMGLGIIPSDHPLFIGMLGMHGAPYTNYLLRETDLLIAVGVRFDDRATGKLEEFCPEARVIHIDIDTSEINKIRFADVGIHADAGEALTALLSEVKKRERGDWLSRIRKLKKEAPYPWPETADISHPVNWMTLLGQLLPEDSVLVTDVGQHQMWTAQIYPFSRPRTFLTSGGLGTMGFGLPTALGAAMARPDLNVICITGDGSLLMNIQELAVLAEENLNVKVLLFNNGQLGLVRQQQELFYDKIYAASVFSAKPDFAVIAGGFGVPGIDLTDAGDPVDELKRQLSRRGPVLINIPVREAENVFPMVPPGAGNHVMLGEKTTAGIS